MQTLDTNYVSEENKLFASGAWLWLVEIITTGYTTLRYTNDNARVDATHYALTWNGHQYWAMPMAMDDVSMATTGEFPTYKLMLEDDDIGGVFRSRVQANAGLVGSMVRLMVVHSEHLAVTTPAIDEYMEILGCEVTARAVTFTVGIPSLLSRRFPRDRYVPTFCRHKFGGALCQYTQSPYLLTSTQVQFIPSGVGEPGERYNTIYVGDGNLIGDVFAWADGEYQGAQYALTTDVGFTVSGSALNDGFFVANNFHAVDDHYVRVFVEADGGRPFYAESAGASVTIRLGYNACDHTLEACQLRNNTQNYGGSPGIAGGVYG